MAPKFLSDGVSGGLDVSGLSAAFLGAIASSTANFTQGTPRKPPPPAGSSIGGVAGDGAGLVAG